MKIERLGKVIKLKRKELKLTMRELAHKAGVHRTYVSKIESHSLTPAYHVLLKLESALGIDLQPFYFKKKSIQDAEIISPTFPKLPHVLAEEFQEVKEKRLAQFIHSNVESVAIILNKRHYEALLKAIAPEKVTDGKLFEQVFNIMQEMKQEKEEYWQKFIQQSKRIKALIIGPKPQKSLFKPAGEPELANRKLPHDGSVDNLPSPPAK